MSSVEHRHEAAQISGAVVATLNEQRAAALESALETIRTELKEALAVQEQAFLHAKTELEGIREFVGSPLNILGSDRTKHGEIAEKVEVGVRRARDFVRQLDPRATFDGVPRTAPADYLIDGLEVQSKFINGARNSLDAVLRHNDTYPNFAELDGYYHIPKDQFADILRIKNGEETEFSAKTVRAILRLIREIENTTERSFEQVVQPGISNYAEVQQGAVHATIERHEKDVTHLHGEQNERLNEEERASRAEAHDSSGPTLTEGLTAAATGAAIGAILSGGAKFHEKLREGKNPFKNEFTAQDWRDVGLATSHGAGAGGVSAGAIYALTNATNLAAPFAASFVSATMGMKALHASYKRGEIDKDEFVELGLITCGESAIIGLSTTIGQAIIPIPILGAVLGAASGRILLFFTKKYLAGLDKEFAAEIDAAMMAAYAAVDREYERIFQSLMAAFDRLNDLTEAAFSFQNNTALHRLIASVVLAEEYGVPESRILTSVNDIDDFMLS